MEPYLAKTVNQLANKDRVINLSELVNSSHKQGGHDFHFWLNPEIAAHLVSVIAKELTLIDQKNTTKYKKNAAMFEEKLGIEVEEAKRRLASVKGEGFVVLHDAYGHFVAYFGLNQLGEISDSADHRHGAKNMTQLKQYVLQGQAQCVVAEQGGTGSSSQRALVRGSDIPVVIIDPLARSTSLTAEGYLRFFGSVVDGFYHCLADKKKVL